MKLVIGVVTEFDFQQLEIGAEMLVFRRRHK